MWGGAECAFLNKQLCFMRLHYPLPIALAMIILFAKFCITCSQSCLTLLPQAKPSHPTLGQLQSSPISRVPQLASNDLVRLGKGRRDSLFIQMNYKLV